MNFKVLAYIAEQIKGITLEEFSSRFSSFYKTEGMKQVTYTFFDKDFVSDLTALQTHEKTYANEELALGFEELNQFESIVTSISFKINI